MQRHQWTLIEKDHRLSVLDPRPKLDRCTVCGLVRCHYWNSRKTYYWIRDEKRWFSERPECSHVRQQSA